MTTEIIHSGNIRHMSRDELEGCADSLNLAFNDDESDQELRDAIMLELTERGRLSEPEEIRDERSDEDVYEGRE